MKSFKSFKETVQNAALPVSTLCSLKYTYSVYQIIVLDTLLVNLKCIMSHMNIFISKLMTKLTLAI